MMDKKNEILHDELKKEFAESKHVFNNLQEINLQLRELNRKLEESERMKSHFISNIRNEIVNPFASIIGLALHIQTCNADQMATIKRMASMIYNEAASLDFQLKNIFTAAEIEAGEIKFNYTKRSLSEVIKSVVDMYAVEIAKHKLNVLHVAESFIQETIIDPDKIKLILSNLLNNCIKYSPEESIITISSSISNGTIYLSIADSGVGISKEDQPLIFDRFKRLNTDISTQNSGYGLGLTVTKGIVEALSGKITIVSDKGTGSIFYIEIPEATSMEEGDLFNTEINDIMF